MEVLYPRCAGLDVHKDVIVAAVRFVSLPRHQEVRSFATTTSGLLALSEWLTSHGCTHVAMKGTPIQELRDLTRTRKQLTREISQHSLRLQKSGRACSKP